MTHGYRTFQHWNQWLTQKFLGSHLLQAEQQILSCLLNKHFGYHALLIGVPNQFPLLHAINIPSSTLISPLIPQDKKNFIESDFVDLPILTGSIDLVILPHTLDFLDNPRQLISEACRIIKPEGLIVICGFNPYSLWGLNKLIATSKAIPWTGNFIHTHKIKNWLQLADFQLEQKKTLLFRPPISHQTLFAKLNFIEKMGGIFFPYFGAVYIFLARAKVIPLTPIRLKWKQQLDGIRISTISGHVARQNQMNS